MNTASIPACQCVDCPGAGCRCGCQGDAQPQSAVQQRPCMCGPRCACNAAEPGCRCGLPT